MTRENKISPAQVRANRNWEKRNPKKHRVDSSRRQARSFVRRFAQVEDLVELWRIFLEENQKLPVSRKDEEAFLDLVEGTLRDKGAAHEE